jgi:hypothetical protein
VASTAAVCPKWAGYRDSSIGEVFASPPCLPGDAGEVPACLCYLVSRTLFLLPHFVRLCQLVEHQRGSMTAGGGVRAVMGGGGYSFVSPAIDWQGVCVRGACAICLEGEKRCTASSEAGTPQVRAPKPLACIK